MTDATEHDGLAQVRADLAALSAAHAAELAVHAAALATLRCQLTRRSRRRLVPAALVAFLVALVPLGLLAANPFTDLNPNSVHNPNVDAIYSAGITTGCVPNQQYCPNDVVTREQMASFLAGTAGLGSNPPVANAKTVSGYAPNGLTRVARAAGEGADLPLDANFTGVVTLTITAPGRGLVVVIGAATMYIASPGGSIGKVEVRLHDTTAVGGGTSPAQIVSMDSGYYQPASATWVFNAGTGGPRTYTLEMRLDNGTAFAVRSGSSMTAIFSPFGADGEAQEH